MKLSVFKFLAILVAANPMSCAHAAESKLHPQIIEKLTGLKGSYNEKEGVFKVTYPRTDLEVEVAGVKMNPALGLTAWVAFTETGNHTAIMGDIVLTEGQVNAVMSAALDNGLEVTALHNHFFQDQPRIMFMHVGGMGDEESLAKSVGALFKILKETAAQNAKFPVSSIDPKKTALDPKKIDQVLGHPGDLKEGVYKVTIGRRTAMGGHTMGNAMGVNTWAAFAGSDNNAVVDGDFAMLEGELQPVLKALRNAGINIVAIHNHMTTENPRIVFLHFWGTGSTNALAKGLKSALDTQKL